MNKLKSVVDTIGFIEQHMTEKLDLAVVANAVDYSKYHLHRMFTDTVGLTIHEYIKRRKLTESAKLLAFSRKSLLDISLGAGYESQQAFTDVFRSMYKQTPKQFRENGVFYPLQLKYELNDHFDLLEKGKEHMEREIFCATEADIVLWMELVRLIIDGFPYLDEEQHINVLKKYISEKRAFIMKDGSIAIDIMMLSYHTQNLDFLGIHPLYRKKGLAKVFLDKAFYELLDKKQISITTFREGDKADTGHRMALKKLGFVEAELLMEFGYPTQRMIFGGENGY